MEALEMVYSWGRKGEKGRRFNVDLFCVRGKGRAFRVSNKVRTTYTRKSIFSIQSPFKIFMAVLVC